MTLETPYLPASPCSAVGGAKLMSVVISVFKPPRVGAFRVQRLQLYLEMSEDADVKVL
jgi:hypothetical protein